MPSHVGTIHPKPSFSGVDGTEVWEARQEIQSFVCTAADVAVGEWVALDTSVSGANKIINSIKKAGDVATHGNAMVIGVALDATSGGAAGQVIRVCTAGVCTAAVTGSTAVGSPLTVIGTAGVGSLTTAAAVAGVCGVTLAAESGGFATVCVFKKI